MISLCFYYSRQRIIGFFSAIVVSISSMAVESELLVSYVVSDLLVLSAELELFVCFFRISIS